jgi:hypothetical protein
MAFDFGVHRAEWKFRRLQLTLNKLKSLKLLFGTRRPTVPNKNNSNNNNNNNTNNNNNNTNTFFFFAAAVSALGFLFSPAARIIVYGH